MCSRSPFIYFLESKTRLVRNLPKNLCASFLFVGCHRSTRQNCKIPSFQLLFGSIVWCNCLLKVFEPRTIEMEEWEFFFDRCCLTNALFLRHAGTRFIQSLTGAFLACLLLQVLIILFKTIRFLEESSFERITNCPPMAQVVAKDRTLKNANPANRGAPTEVPILGPNLFENWKSWSLFKKDRMVHKTIGLEDQLNFGV